MNELFDLIEILAIGALVVWSWKAVNGRKPANPFDAARQQANLEIIKMIQKYAEEHPTQRFGQILRNIGILQDIGVRDSSKPEWETPDYYIDRILLHEEPQRILARMKKELAEQNRQ